jgi:dTDP-4-dehydrorhamnose reductase
MKVLVLGANGMLGHKLVSVLNKRFEVWATVRNSLEQINFNERIIYGVNAEVIQEVKNAIEKIEPNVIVNAIGIIKQVESSKNIVKALTVNSIFPHLVSEIANEIGARFISISTDCVFSGEKGNYTESDFPDAKDIYGKSKNLGEVVGGNSLTIRTSIIGHEINTSHSLLDWFLSNRGGSVSGFKNAIFSGFPTVIFSEIIGDIIEKHMNLKGLYHVSSEAINKYDLLCLINEKYKSEIEIIKDETFRIDRSLDSTKFSSETGFISKTWDVMIEIMAKDRGKLI